MPGNDRNPRGRGLVGSLRRWFSGAATTEQSAPQQAPERIRPRSAAPVLWCHADGPSGLLDLSGLLQRMTEEVQALSILLTTRGLVSDAVLGPEFPDNITLEPCPPEDADSIDAFLSSHLPDICVWSGSSYAPSLITEAARRGIPMLNVNATFPKNIWRRARIVRRSLRRLLMQFSAVYAIDRDASTGLRKFGLPEGLIRNEGRLVTVPPVLPHDEAVEAQLRKAIGTRPLWLACGVTATELPLVLEAFRDAARLTHRLLLVLQPLRQRDGAAFATRLAENDWGFVVRSDDQEPAFETQVVLDDTGQELGLWLRLAPVCFLGNSLEKGGGCDPLVAAALGSAIVHGPRVGDHLSAYERLTRVGGSVEVSSAKSLTEAVCELSIPDRAASMAHAAWLVESEGAHTIRVLEQDILQHLGLAREEVA